MAAFSSIALGMMIAGSGVQAYAAYKGGKAAKEAGKQDRAAAESQAELSDYNAAVADLQAQDAIQRGQEEESRYRQGVRTMLGSQRAGFAASNVSVAYGSAVDVQADTAYLGELDALTIRTNAGREAWGYQVAAVDYRKRAEITRKEGINLEKAGGQQAKQQYLGAASSLLGAGGSLLASRYGYGGKTGMGRT